MLKHLVLSLCLFSIAIAQPSPAASEASIRELLDITKVRALVDQMMDQMDQTMKLAMVQASQGHEPSPKVKAVIDRMQSRVMDVLKEEIDWSVIEPIYISIYRESFSQKEVDDMLAFYRTPTGQAVINKLPMVMQKSMNSMHARMEPMMQKLQVIQEDALREIQTNSDDNEANQAPQSTSPKRRD